ncbi:MULTISPECIES: DUF7848 domain-containing protein [Streptomyces]|uniref:DUF7848 domain-containing protein n=2 Tax=Streptomyces TaxID=1883 RepID=A0AA89QKI0_STRCU|nr:MULTISPECIES: hypothetical protein [Streptomyces]MBB5813004.1 hypothetical protein [Streptomyces collinus]MEC7055894.1 hypothetical protein [Streptomyces violaceochromogenes]WMX66128.1 hypothetical protein RFN52_23310 [Streptomyces collinus]GHC69861.1 hypothetical protein GCM10010309_37450 [Streptomyces violaceochromogenes]
MEPGTLVYDPQTCKVGEYQDRTGPYVMLRPVGGGREWQADPARIREATPEERLSAGVRALNDRSREGLSADPTRPPSPVPGCAACEELALRRDRARAAFDGSAVTDANVLLRQHQRAEHGGESTGRRIFRYVPYTIVQDASALPEYEAYCVSGEERDCGAGSGRCQGPGEVEEWQRRHTQETRHLRYRRSFADYAVLQQVTAPSVSDQGSTYRNSGP